MPRDQGKDKVTVRLWRGDKEHLAAYYPNKGYNEAIREIVHRQLRRLDELYQKRNPDKVVAEQSPQSEQPLSLEDQE